MKTTAIPLSRLRLVSPPSLAERLPGFIALMKPRVMVLAVFAALVGVTRCSVRTNPEGI